MLLHGHATHAPSPRVWLGEKRDVLACVKWRMPAFPALQGTPGENALPRTWGVGLAAPSRLKRASAQYRVQAVLEKHGI